MPRVASNSRNDEFVNTTPCPLRHYLEWNDEAIHKPLIINTKTEKKEFHKWIIIPYTEIATSCKQLSQWRVCVCCHCERSEAIHKPQKVNAKTENKKNSPPLFPFVIANETKQSTKYKKQSPLSSLQAKKQSTNHHSPLVITKAEDLWQFTNHKLSLKSRKEIHNQ